MNRPGAHLPASCVLLAVVLASAGCVSKSTHQELAAELAECRDAEASLQAANVAWERRFDRESERWETLGQSVTDAVPQALVEFHEERDQILEMVPEQVQTEVRAYLEDYFGTVSQGFQVLKADNEDIKLELAATRKALEVVGADARSISTAVDRTLAEEREARQAARDRAAEVSGQLATLTALVVDFDRNRVDCKKCDDKIGLGRKEREAILAFHDELTREIAAIQARLGSGAPAPATTAE
jgi:hypothetical protein